MQKGMIAVVVVGIFAYSLVFAGQAPQKRQPQDCKVYDAPYTYEGKMVTIRAVYSPSLFDGEFLIDNRCKVTMWFTTPTFHKTFALLSAPTYPHVREPSFGVIDDKEYERFTHFAYATSIDNEPMFTVTATFVGRLDRSKNFNLGKNGLGNGFGAGGASEFQFILQSVSDLDVEQAPSHLPQPIHSTLPDRVSDEK